MSSDKSIKLLVSLNDVRDEFIYEAQENPIARRPIRKRSKALPIAACISILLLSATVFASAEWGVTLLEKFTSRTLVGSDHSESGYDLSINIEKKALSAFQGDIQEVPALIIEQFEHNVAFSSWYAGHWQGTFNSSDEAINFIGLKELRKLEWALEEEQSILNVYGNESGGILSLTLETRYVVDDIHVQVYSSIYTEESDNPVTTGVITTEAVEFEESYYESPKEILCYIIRSSPLKSGNCGLEGYLVQEGIFYHIHIAYQKDDQEKAEGLLYQWADSF